MVGSVRNVTAVFLAAAVAGALFAAIWTWTTSLQSVVATAPQVGTGVENRGVIYVANPQLEVRALPVDR